eukprot:GILJ01007074.1.p1 GENE.GILJ01007074.1~~GILJ01007074.1.p1  ORF type:complete len:308 (+),score=52.20 GILJ01007074.1:245-1168(+)
MSMFEDQTEVQDPNLVKRLASQTGVGEVVQKLQAEEDEPSPSLVEQEHKFTDQKKPVTKAVIFDLGRVLFDKSWLKAGRRVKKWTMTKYLLKGNNPLKLRHLFFEVLQGISAYPTDLVYYPTYEGTVLPNILNLWMRNAEPTEKIIKDVHAYIDRYQGITCLQREILHDLASITFNPDDVANVMVPIDEGITLLKAVRDKAKDNGVKVMLLSNFNAEAFNMLHKSYGHIFQLFDALCVSGHLNMMKPESNIYQTAVEMIDVHPSQCVFIDDSPENVDAANRCGMTGIWLKDFDYVHLRERLVQMGLV